jgi:hypothetical protein
MDYPPPLHPLPLSSKLLPQIPAPGTKHYCPVSSKEVADYFKVDDLPMLGLLPKKPKEYWDALAKKYPSNDESFVRGIPSQLLATRVIYRLIALYPGLLKHVKDVSALSTIEKGVQIVGDVGSLGFNAALRTVTDKVLIPIVKGCRQEELDLLTPSAMGTIDKYLGSSHSVMISESEHATIVKKQQDGTYLHFNSHGVTREDKLIKKLQNFVGPDKTLVHSTCPRFQGTRGVCLLWSLLFIIFPEKSGDELWKMLNAAHERQQIFEHPFARAMPLYVKDVSSDLILIAIFENFVEMTDRKLDELPPSIKSKLRTALGGRRKTRKLKLKSIKPSHKKEKKWDATFIYPDGHQKVVPFGAKGMSDYTKHKDDTRKQRYLKRHSGMGESWQKPDTPGALAKWVLWNKKTLRASIADYKKRFKLG